MTEPEDDFAAMFEASLKPRRFDKGQTLEGVIVGIGPDVAFVDVGGKGEATINLAELRDADGNIEVAVGDRIQATVMSTGGGVTLSRKLVRHAANARQLESAFQAGLPVEGKVEAEVKGGYEVRVAGQRAFCPYSQIDIRRTEPATHIGRVYQFRMIEYKDGGKTLVVSRRANPGRRAKGEGGRDSAIDRPGRRAHRARDVGSRVRRLRRSRRRRPGPPARIGNGMVARDRPVSGRQARRGDHRRVLRVDDDGKKIALGLKQLTANPWSTVPTKYEVGQVHTGRVTRVAEFGAFVELEPGVEALAHVSTFAPTGRSREWASQVPVGTTAPFEILSIDLEKKRIGVALVPEGSTRAGAVTAASGEDSEETPAEWPIRPIRKSGRSLISSAALSNRARRSS